LPVVVVTGLRQSGKTTFLQRDPRLAGRRYVGLDDSATLRAARRDPEGLLAGDEPLTIDEAQRSPELL
jgi:predicted AAA+ superfamily ATPase